MSEATNKAAATIDSDTVERFELLGVAGAVEVSRCLMADVIQEFFDPFNPDTQDGRACIAMEYKRNRARAQAVFDQLRDAQAILNKHDIKFWDC